MSEPITDPEVSNPTRIEIPAPTAWPLVVGVGVTLFAAGFAINLAFSAVGAVLAIAGVAGWVSNLFPGRGHVHERLRDLTQQPRPIEGAVGRVGHLRPGSPGFRFQLPLKVRPISAGIKGGIVGGVVMPIPALVYGFQSGHGIWFPVNLLAAMVVPSLDDADVVQLEQFRLSGLLVGIAIHAVFSVGFGLFYGVLLPTLPDLGGLGPIFWGGILMPLLWTGVCYGLMGIVNPVLEQHVDWIWFLLSQFAYGIVMALMVFREEKILVPPAGVRR